MEDQFRPSRTDRGGATGPAQTVDQDAQRAGNHYEGPARPAATGESGLADMSKSIPSNPTGRAEWKPKKNNHKKNSPNVTSYK